MGDYDMTKAFIQQRYARLHIHARTTHGHTALHAAALFGHPSVVSLLVECGLDVNAQNVEGLVLVDEVLDDIDYAEAEQGGLEESESVTRAGGGCDPFLLETAAVQLLRNGATISPTSAAPFHEKFCVAWGDVASEDLQYFIGEALDIANQQESERERLDMERASTPALVVRALDGPTDAAAPDAATRAREEKEPSLFKGTATPGAGSPAPSGGKSGRARMGRLRHRRYVQSPAGSPAAGKAASAPFVSPTKPPSPNRTPKPTAPDKSPAAAGTMAGAAAGSGPDSSAAAGGGPQGALLSQLDLSEPPAHGVEAQDAAASAAVSASVGAESEGSIDVSWSKQLAQGNVKLPQIRK